MPCREETDKGTRERCQVARTKRNTAVVLDIWRTPDPCGKSAPNTTGAAFLRNPKQHILASPPPLPREREDRANFRKRQSSGFGRASKPQMQGSCWSNAQKVKEGNRHLAFCMMFECQTRRGLKVNLRLED